ALEVVVDVDLPVAGDLVGHVLVVAEVFQAASGADARLDACNQLVEGHGRAFVDAGEDQALPCAHRHFGQANGGDVEAFDALHSRRRLQLSVQAIGPAVV